MEFKCSAKKIVSLFLRVALSLIALHILFSLLDFHPAVKVDFFLRIFDLDREANIPTLFSAFLLLSCGFFLGLIARQERREKRKSMGFFWTMLSFLFIFLALDEGAHIHERIGDVVETQMLDKALPIQPHGFLYFPWILPYTAAAFLIGLIYLWFLSKLPRRTRLLFVIAAAMFLAGSLGFEVFSAREADIFGTGSFIYWILYTIEESLEMGGVILFLSAILEFYRTKMGHRPLYPSERIRS